MARKMWKKELEKYFNSLVREFIKNPIYFTFKYKKSLGLFLKRGRRCYVRGKTACFISRKRRSFLGIFKWWSPPKYKYVVSFLNSYQNTDEWRGILVHEFAHLYLYNGERIKSQHEHDDKFYSKMDYFENWLDKEWNLPPRQNKDEDWSQHVDYKKRLQRKAKYENHKPTTENNSSWLKRVSVYIPSIPFIEREN